MRAIGVGAHLGRFCRRPRFDGTVDEGCEFPEPMVHRKFETPDAIRAEIADLVRRRDGMLKRAPERLIWHRVIGTLILFFTLFGAGTGLLKQLGYGQSLGLHRVMVGVLVALFAAQCYRLWRPSFDARDPWAASDRIGYEGDSPRELQGRIERLEAKLHERG